MSLRGLEVGWTIRKRLLGLLHSTEGSIAVITIGLFFTLLSTALVLTNISATYLAKRSLTQATEAAVQRGMKNLDTESYYSGEYNLTQLLQNSLGDGETDPGIPIDCNKGLEDAREVLENWSRTESSRINLIEISLVDFKCDGFQIYVQSAARAELPFILPFAPLNSLPLSSSAGAIGERAETNNYYGLDFG
jgi:Flp pilus assembly protein TadG